MALHATPKVMKLVVRAFSRWLHERAPQLSLLFLCFMFLFWTP